MRNSLAICVVFTICSGQACIPSGSAPIPTPPQLGSVISEGIYSGSVNTTYVSKINTTVIEEFTEMAPLQAVFGADGFPLNERNEPIQIGETMTVDMGGASLGAGVVGLNSVSNGIQIRYEANLHYTIGQESFLFEGSLTETYVRVEDGTLDVSVWGAFGHVTYDGYYLSLTMNGRGRLTR